MITEPELRDALARQAESYQVPPLDLVRPRAVARRRRRATRLRYGGLAAAALLGAGIALGQLGAGEVEVPPADRGSDATIPPSCLPSGGAPPVPEFPYAGPGFLSEDPVRATAPDGGPCRLVLRYGFHRFGAGAGLGGLIGIPDESGFSGWVWLYSDGRLIVETQEDWFVQWERRLTPAGVERVRKAVVNMLGEPAGPPADPLNPDALHYGHRTFYPEDPKALVRLLIDRSWLPDEYWVRASPSIYRAAWYVTCYEEPEDQGDDVMAAVRELPSGARDVLESRPWTALTPDVAQGLPAWLQGMPRTTCVVLSRADATRFVEAQGGDMPRAGIAIAYDPLAGTTVPSDETMGRFYVHALMPDGTPGAHGD